MKHIATIAIAVALMLAGLQIVFGQPAAAPLNTGLEDLSPAAPKDDVFADFAELLRAQRFASGVAVSPLDVNNPAAEVVVYWKGPSIGQKGLSLIPGLHKPDAKPYFDLDFGGGIGFGGGTRSREQRVLVIVNAHVLNLSEWTLNKLPGKSRIRMPKLSEKLAFGPMFRIPLPGETTPWTWRNGFKIIGSYGFGGPKEK